MKRVNTAVKKIIVVLLLIYLFTNFLISAFYYIPEFGEVYGIGGAGTVGSIGGVESVFYNPAGLAELKNKEFVSSYNKHIITEGADINIYNLGYVLPIKFGVKTAERKLPDGRIVKYVLPINFAAGIGIYGMDVNSGLYKENIYYLAIGGKLGNTSEFANIFYGVTAKILTLSYDSDDYTKMDPVFKKGYKKDTFTLDTGIAYTVNKNIIFGLNIVNLLPADVGIKEKENLKTAFNFGCKYRFYSSEILFEIRYRNKIEDYILGYRQGLFKNKFYISAGINSSTANLSLKYRIYTPNFIIEPIYSFSYPYEMISYGSHNVTLKIKF